MIVAAVPAQFLRSAAQRLKSHTFSDVTIVNVAKVQATVDTGNRWNTMEIVARGGKMTVRVNGTLVSEGEDRKFARGPIALQYGGGDVRFRKVEVR